MKILNIKIKKIKRTIIEWKNKKIYKITQLHTSYCMASQDYSEFYGHIFCAFFLSFFGAYELKIDHKIIKDQLQLTEERLSSAQADLLWICEVNS